MEITEVRIKLMEEPGERLQAFCSITFDDCFRGARPEDHRGRQRSLRGHAQSQVDRTLSAMRLEEPSSRGLLQPVRRPVEGESGPAKDEEGRAKLYADIAHPINSSCREMIQQRVIAAFEEEKVRAKLPGYVPSYDDFDQEEALVDLRADAPAPPAGPSHLPRVQPQVARAESRAPRAEPQVSRAEPPAVRSKPPVQPVESQAPPAQPQAPSIAPQVSQGEKPQGPHKAPAHVSPPSDRSKPGNFGAGIFE